MLIKLRYNWYKIYQYHAINGIRGKFTEASELLTEELLDILLSKLDVSFPSP